MSIRKLVQDKPDNLDLSKLVDSGDTPSEAMAAMDARDAAVATGQLMAFSTDRDHANHLIARFWWRAESPHGRRLVNARTNLEG